MSIHEVYKLNEKNKQTFNRILNKFDKLEEKILKKHEENVEGPIPRWLFIILEKVAVQLNVSIDKLVTHILCEYLKDFEIEMRV